MEQRRQFSRVLFKADATLSGNVRSAACEVLDLSLKGALVRVANSEPWRPELDCVLELALDADHQQLIRMAAKVAHRNDHVVGLHCVEIDLDSVTHLRRLVELNLGDDALLQRELAALSAD